MAHLRTVAITIALLGLALLAAMSDLDSGSTPSTWAQIWHGLWDPEDNLGPILWSLRLPRVAAGLGIGAALAAAGAVFQSMSRNALGSPDIIGFISGAAMGAVVSLVVFQTDAGIAALAALVSGIAVSIAVYALSWRDGRLGTDRLVLIGIGVNALLQAGNTLILTQSNPMIAIAGQQWLTGTLNARTWAQAWMGLGAALALIPILLLLSRRLNALELGDDLARQTGVPIESTRLIALATGIGLVALATAAAGPIVFIALAAPHLTRLMLRNGSIPILPCALLGATLLVGADALSQSLPEVLQVPVGITTGVIGGIYLLWMVSRER